MFLCKSVWLFLFERDELGDFCKGFDVECSCSAYAYGDNVDICFWRAMLLEGLLKRLVDDVDVVYNLLHASVSGVFAFDELELSSSLVGRVFDEFAVGLKCVSNRPNKDRSVMCWSFVCRKDVFWYGVSWFHRVWLVVL